MGDEESFSCSVAFLSIARIYNQSQQLTWLQKLQIVFKNR